MSTDQHIVCSDSFAQTLNFRTDLAIMCSRFWRERKHLKARDEMLDGLKMLKAPHGFFRAVIELTESYARYGVRAG